MRKVLGAMALLSLTACVSANPEAQAVRITSNPDVVKQCEFVDNVRAMSGWGSGGIGQRNIEETLKERAHELGANVIYMVSQASGREPIGSGTAEAYRCLSPR